MVERTGLTFVALGDSLTAGFIPYNPLQPQRSRFPYTELLDDILTEVLSRKRLDHVEVSLVNLGVNGDTTLGMLQRFDEQVSSESPDYVIVWGGINDNYEMRSLEDTMKNLKQIYERISEAGADPIACTVTPVLGFDHIIPPIRRLNDLIEEHCGKNGTPVADLFAATSDESRRLMGAYSSDGVHLTKEGYEKIALIIYSDVVEPILDKFTR